MGNQQQFLSEADLQKVFGGLTTNNPATNTGLQPSTIDCEKTTTSTECSIGSLIRK